MRDSLAERAAGMARRALAEGALRPLASELHRVPDSGVEFQVRLLRGRDHKAEAAEPEGAGPSTNPFLPPDPALLVGELSATHLCVLNKYPVLEGHLLAVTRDFEPQGQELTAPDLAALWTLLLEIDGLGFYNSHAESGASQPHKHLQLVPALAPGCRAPIEPLLRGAGTRPGPVAGLPFAHAAQRLTALPGWDAGAGTALARFAGDLRAALSPEQRQRPYNLLLTRDWMLWIPRSRGDWEGASVNALGFAGSLVVRDRRALARVRSLGPLKILGAVALPRGGFPLPWREWE